MGILKMIPSLNKIARLETNRDKSYLVNHCTDSPKDEPLEKLSSTLRKDSPKQTSCDFCAEKAIMHTEEKYPGLLAWLHLRQRCPVHLAWFHSQRWRGSFSLASLASRGVRFIQRGFTYSPDAKLVIFPRLYNTLTQ